MIEPRVITLQEAEAIAVEALLQAEKRRREAREADAEIWQTMIDRWNNEDDDTTIPPADVA